MASLVGLGASASILPGAFVIHQVDTERAGQICCRRPKLHQQSCVVTIEN